MPEIEDQAALSNSVRMSEDARNTLAAKLEGKLDAAFTSSEDDVDDTETVAEETPAAVETEETPAAETTEEKPGEEKPAEETTETETETEAEAAAPVAESKATDAPTLPAAYRRSLKAYEWTDAEIEAALKQGGQGFITTAAKIHANRNTEVQRWAEAGRAARQQTTPNKDEAASQQTTTTEPELLKPVDVAALKKQYGDEALVDSLAGPVNRAIAEINRIMPVVRQSQQQAQMAQLETLGKQVDGFFGGKELEPYHEQYGTATATLNNEQMASRQKVLELADALIGGARQQGRALTLGDALQLAHDSVSGPVKEKAARTAIAKQLTTRNRAITLKPTTRGASALSGGNSRPAKTDAERMSKVSAGLKAAFG